MKYGYARVSTRTQLNGNSIEAQENRLREEGCQVIVHDSFTGTKADRPEFTKILNKLQAGDTLVVTKLDRLARSVRDAIDIVRDLFDRDVKIHVLNMGLVENTPTGRLIFNIMSSFAEFERDMIVERTQEGKAIARQRDDFRDGRPNKYSKKQLKHAMKLLETNSYTQVEEMTGISKSTLTRAKRKEKAEQEKKKATTEQ